MAWRVIGRMCDDDLRAVYEHLVDLPEA